MLSTRSAKIRPAEQQDVEFVRDLLRTTWYDAYKFIPKEDLDWYLDAHYSLPKLIDLLKTEREDCLVYENDDQITGWMRLRSDNDNNVFSVVSLYVLPSEQGKGVGKALLNYACNFALEYRFEKVTLGVMTQNESSVAWYKNHGFEIVGKEPFIMGKTEVEHLILEKVIFFQ
jgi:ribosomal protein S18 acetylase RimI-like enzyme